jgi:histidine triad (HIT) family protein
MSEQKSCLFCRMIAGEVPADLLHKDESCVAIRDINPQAPSHILVIPREHIESLNEASHRDEALLGHLLRVCARIANDQGHAEDGYRTVINTGAGAGQSVFHLHVHVLGGRSMHWPPG